MTAEPSGFLTLVADALPFPAGVSWGAADYVHQCSRLRVVIETDVGECVLEALVPWEVLEDCGAWKGAVGQLAVGLPGAVNHVMRRASPNDPSDPRGQ